MTLARTSRLMLALLAMLTAPGCSPAGAAAAQARDAVIPMPIPWPEWWDELEPPERWTPVQPAAAPPAGPAARPAAALLDMLTSWLVLNFALPGTPERPAVARVPQARLALLRHRGVLSDRLARSGPEAPLGDPQAVYAVYDDDRRTIYLPQDWEGETPGEISVLVHELVHHLQNMAGAKFACPQEREKPAYEAQSRWLALFGRSLQGELGIDAFDVLVRTECLD